MSMMRVCDYCNGQRYLRCPESWIHPDREVLNFLALFGMLEDWQSDGWARRYPRAIIDIIDETFRRNHIITRMNMLPMKRERFFL